MSPDIPYLLIVDDDPALREMLQAYLTGQGFRVRSVGDGLALDAELAREAPDLLLLDLMLPGEDGLTISRRLRVHSQIPIVILSARGEDVDRIVGLELGADDYLAKPFNPRELVARIRAVLRRRAQAPAPVGEVIVFGPFRLDLAGHGLTRAGVPISLTTAEFTLLAIFVRHPNRVLSRDRLVELVQDEERMPFDRSIDVRVARLRKKIEPDAENPCYIRTVWGAGYLFVPHGEAE